MRGRIQEPDAAAVKAIAKNIAAQSPLAVVLTGGDPLVSPHLATAIESLSSQAGLIIDTSAYTLTSRHLGLFRDNRVFVRVSLDCESPRIHDVQRPLARSSPKAASSLFRALRGIDMLLNANVEVGVQTVATKLNATELPGLGHKLFRMGVRHWRVLKIAPSQSAHSGFLELAGPRFASGKPYNHVFDHLVQLHQTHWSDRMSLQIATSDVPNAVVLVAPDGTFYTEGNIGTGKVLIDPSASTNPSKDAISQVIDMPAHLRRYLNLNHPHQKGE